jgi:ABC-type Mn2+/Zn2+ transport system ATPase subunit
VFVNAQDSARQLDEPTAALDARAEYEVFERFKELSRGKTVLLVAHSVGSIGSQFLSDWYTRRECVDRPAPVPL